MKGPRRPRRHISNYTMTLVRAHFKRLFIRDWSRIDEVLCTDGLHQLLPLFRTTGPNGTFYVTFSTS